MCAVEVPGEVLVDGVGAGVAAAGPADGSEAGDELRWEAGGCGDVVAEGAEVGGCELDGEAGVCFLKVAG